MTVPLDELLAEGRAALRAGDAVGARRALESARRRIGIGRRDRGSGSGGRISSSTTHRRSSGGSRRTQPIVTAATTWVRCAWPGRSRTCTSRSRAIGRCRAGGSRAPRRSSPRRSIHPNADGSRSTSRCSKATVVARRSCFREALELARGFADTDLEFVTLAYLGASLVHADRTEEGMTLLDEALAAVAGSEVDDFLVLEEIFCQLFSACEHAHDVARADQWIRIGEAIAERRQLPSVSAFCRTHYGGVLTAAGRWPEADTALTEAVRLWGARSPLDVAQRRARSARRPARPPGPVRGSRATARRDRRHRQLRSGPPDRGDPSRQGRAGPRHATSSSGPSTRSTRRARRPRRCWRCSSMCTSRPTGSTTPSGRRTRSRRAQTVTRVTT